ncbi:hypothetical protein NGB36_16510 [Streptomyces sp. RB6PN25]|uniref:Transposase n=1 Tax=Streptomyces humicola TaxID=2953240 RepID=A0ABT1PWV5_9ACTN|nr:hypothetical protein [Streptomyces humicola]MCQ4082166.1 hypothetical protein [Streptomyces humicola]
MHAVKLHEAVQAEWTASELRDFLADVLASASLVGVTAGSQAERYP